MLRLSFPLLLSAALGLPGCAKSRPQPGVVPSASAVVSAVVAPSARVEPDTVSQASPTYDGGPPVMPSSSEEVDGAKLREQHIARLKSDRSPVTVLTGGSALELGQRLCEAVVPRRQRHVPVLVKPNLCGFDGFKTVKQPGGDDGVTGRVTDAEFTRGVVRCLKARGHERIVVADGCGNSHAHWLRAVELSGHSRMAAEEQVPLVALDDDGVFDKTGDYPGKPLRITGIEKTHVPTLLMPKLLADVLEHGLFISVPKIKAHRYSVVSLGIKGMQGTVMRSEARPAYNQKWRMHEELKEYLARRKQGEPEDRAQYVASLEAFAERMVDVLEVSLPDAVLAEGAPAMAGDGFQNLRRVPGNIAIGGTNPVLVDRVGAEYLGLWNNAELAKQLGGHRTSPLIEVAARRHGVPLTRPDLAGDGVESLNALRPAFFKAIAPFSIPHAPVAAEVPTAHARHVSAAPLVDGKVEPAWLAAPSVSWQTDFSGADVGLRTTARFLWTEGALFALFELEGAGLNTDQSRPVAVERDKLYQEDCVELFLAPNAAQRGRYFEIELGPFGHFFDLEIGSYGKVSKPQWSSEPTVAATRNEAARTAVVEARFASPDLTGALVAGARLPLALYRMEGKAPRRYLAWRPPRTAKPQFHVPEGFGTLLVDP
ncbi:MAG: hypothetical protein K0R38_2551 [Polyangiaceae bacterium]|jgi:uncharacterized protein (DUF362 family)|nr:hypothetical protein [Polyangiaceae bacterium]